MVKRMDFSIMYSMYSYSHIIVVVVVVVVNHSPFQPIRAITLTKVLVRNEKRLCQEVLRINSQEYSYNSNLGYITRLDVYHVTSATPIQ